jgi:hypothetical protein
MYVCATRSCGDGPQVAYANDSAGSGIKAKQYTWGKALEI